MNFYRSTNIKSIKLIFNYLLMFVFVILFSLYYSLPFFQNLSTDIGYYYLGSSLLDQDFILYRDWFDHKGPVIYFILYLLNFLIGVGVYQIFTFITLLFTIYLVITNLIIAKNFNFKFENIIIVVFCSSIFYIQDFNYDWK